MSEMYAVSGETLTGIADAIRSKTGSDERMTVASMASAIEGISGGGLMTVTHIVFEPDVNISVAKFPVTGDINTNGFIALVISGDAIYDATEEGYIIVTDYAGLRDNYSSGGRYHVIKPGGIKDYYNVGIIYSDGEVYARISSGHYFGAGHKYDIYIIT